MDVAQHNLVETLCFVAVSDSLRAVVSFQVQADVVGGTEEDPLEQIWPV